MGRNIDNAHIGRKDYLGRSLQVVNHKMPVTIDKIHTWGLDSTSEHLREKEKFYEKMRSEQASVIGELAISTVKQAI